MDTARHEVRVTIVIGLMADTEDAAGAAAESWLEEAVDTLGPACTWACVYDTEPQANHELPV